MRFSRVIQTIDSHTEGNPTRVIVGGVPVPPAWNAGAVAGTISGRGLPPRGRSSLIEPSGSG